MEEETAKWFGDDGMVEISPPGTSLGENVPCGSRLGPSLMEGVSFDLPGVGERWSLPVRIFFGAKVGGFCI